MLKILARDDETRPQDQIDLKALAQDMEADDWAEAARLAGLIENRGYARERNLMAALDKLRNGS